MRFPWSKKIPTSREVIEAIFGGFTPEEMEILNGPDSVIPGMYSMLLQESHHLKTRLTMEEVMQVAEREIYSRRGRIRDKKTQFTIFQAFFFCIFSPGEYI